MTQPTLRYETRTNPDCVARIERARCLLRAPEACRREGMALERSARAPVSSQQVAAILTAWPIK